MRFWAKRVVVAEVKIWTLKSIILKADANEFNGLSIVQLIKTLRKNFNSPNAKFVLATGCGNPGREGFGLQIAEAHQERKVCRRA